MQTKSDYSRRSTESKQTSWFAFFLFSFLLACVCILCFLFVGFVSFVCFDSDSDLDQYLVECTIWQYQPTKSVDVQTSFVVVAVAPKNRYSMRRLHFSIGFRLQDSLFRQVYWAVSPLDPLYDSQLSRCPELPQKKILSCFGGSILCKF